MATAKAYRPDETTVLPGPRRPDDVRRSYECSELATTTQAKTRSTATTSVGTRVGSLGRTRRPLWASYPSLVTGPVPSLTGSDAELASWRRGGQQQQPALTPSRRAAAEMDAEAPSSMLDFLSLRAAPRAGLRPKRNRSCSRANSRRNTPRRSKRKCRALQTSQAHWLSIFQSRKRGVAARPAVTHRFGAERFDASPAKLGLDMFRRSHPPRRTRHQRLARAFRPAAGFRSRSLWLIPLGALLFARLWLTWGLLAAAIVVPAALLTSFVIGAFVMAIERRR